jgi:hypothetical protein
MGIWFFDRNGDGNMFTLTGFNGEDPHVKLTRDERKVLVNRIATALKNEDKTVTNVREKIKKAAEQSQAVFNGAGGTIAEALDYFEQVLLGEFME